MTLLAQLKRRLRADGPAGRPPVRVEPAASAEPGIRALLCATALRVTSLDQRGARDDVAKLRTDCVKLIDAFSAELERRRVPADVRQDALWAQCGLLDEAVLRQLTDDERAQWDAQPLQVERFGRHDAGTYVFERIAARLAQASPNADLLEAYAAILGLGFTGRYAAQRGLASGARGAPDADTLENVVAALDARLKHLGRGTSRAFVTVHGKRRLSDRFRQLSPWTVAMLGVVVAAVTFAVWNGLLAIQLSQWLPSKS